MGRETTELIITVAGIMLGVILGIRAILSLFISKEKLKRFHRVLRVPSRFMRKIICRLG